MNFVSIPVHESFESVISQLSNFQKYLECKIILHVSSHSSKLKGKLEYYLSKTKKRDIYINPVSLETSWGNIINAHISNIKYIQCLGAGKYDNIIFHSSNDMFIKKGLGKILGKNKSFFHLRFISQSGHWWPGNVALCDDKFGSCLARHGSNAMVASQVEGSVYPAEAMFEIVKIIMDNKLLESQLFYTREEFFFSSFAYALGLRPDASPYVFSEVHRFDRIDFKLRDFLSSKLFPSCLSKFYIEHINKILFKSRFYRITKKDILNIRNKKIPFIEVCDNADKFVPYNPDDEIFAVKRIPRQNSQIRKFIDLLNLV